MIGTVESSSEDATPKDDVGPETQALLDASKTMLTSPRHTSRVALIPLEEDEVPDSTELTVDPRTALAFKGDDVVKLALLKIAHDCRFLLNEVMEEYEELDRDLDATRSFFEEIRVCIKEKKRTRNKFLG